MGVALLLSLHLFVEFRSGTSAYQFVEWVPWIPSYGIFYHVGVDGISLLLVLLTAFLGPITVLCSWTSIQKKVKEFHIFLLLLQVGMLGVFAAVNLFLFYIFWEAMLIPMYFLIGVWGGPRRVYATTKFVLYTLFGSLLMLVAILYLGIAYSEQFGTTLFDMNRLAQVQLSATEQIWLFAAFALAFAIKVPLFPFHTWLPDAHVEAPTAGSVILAGVLLKMGTYGFIRLAIPWFPQAVVEFYPWLAVLSVFGIIYGALVALVQPDLKKLVAYSSVSHLGFVMLGLLSMTVQGVQGAILQMVNHGLSTGALFLIVGVLYERRHTRMIADYGGLAKQVPFIAAVFMVVCLSSLGLPGLNGFVGELLILVGTFRWHPVYAIVAASGVILAAVYLLWMYQRVMFGKIVHEENQKLEDLRLHEWLSLLPILIGIVWIGLYPMTFLKKSETSARMFASQTRRMFAEETAVDVKNLEGFSLLKEGSPLGGFSLEPKP
jgi:NADH-quinone oxidoreductase subunit M